MTESSILSGQKKWHQISYEDELYLQSAVACFVSEYTVSLSVRFRSSERHSRRHHSSVLPGASVHVGADLHRGPVWGVSYLSLKANSEGKLSFFIRTAFNGSDDECMRHRSAVFLCSVWLRDNSLYFGLADCTGYPIRRFRLDRTMAQGCFYPVIQELQKQNRDIQNAGSQ
jgi:hypothetical protein